MFIESGTSLKTVIVAAAAAMSVGSVGSKGLVKSAVKPTEAELECITA